MIYLVENWLLGIPDAVPASGLSGAGLARPCLTFIIPFIHLLLCLQSPPFASVYSFFILLMLAWLIGGE